MMLLLKAALENRKHFLLLGFTLLAMLIMTLASQMEMFTLGIIAKAGEGFVKVPAVPSGQTKNLVQVISAFLDTHFEISTNLARLALVIVGVAIFKAIALFSYRYTTQLVSIRVSRDLRQKYFEHIQSLPMSFYQEHNIGSLSSRVVGDASVVSNAINSWLINYMQTPFSVISTLIACFWISWKLSLIIFFGFPAIVVPIVYIIEKD